MSMKSHDLIQDLQNQEVVKEKKQSMFGRWQPASETCNVCVIGIWSPSIVPYCSSANVLGLWQCYLVCCYHFAPFIADQNYGYNGSNTPNLLLCFESHIFCAVWGRSFGLNLTWEGGRVKLQDIMALPSTYLVT